MFTVLRMPLTITAPSLHASVLLLSVPATVIWPPEVTVGIPWSSLGGLGLEPGGNGMLGAAIDGTLYVTVPELPPFIPLLQKTAPAPMPMTNRAEMTPNTNHGMPPDTFLA